MKSNIVLGNLKLLFFYEDCSWIFATDYLEAIT